MSATDDRPLLDIGLTCGKCCGALLVYREVCTHEPRCVMGDFSSAGPHVCTGPEDAKS